MRSDRFSRRTGWERRPNRIAGAVRRRREAGRDLLDLTVSNPTRQGPPPEAARILAALAGPGALVYEPDPRGLLPARRAVADLYAARGAGLPAEHLVLTASTSEAYTWLFRLLCDPGEVVLAPSPSYPLFDFLAGVSDTGLETYPLAEEDGFRIDLEALERSVTPATRAVMAVHPGNPTGTFLKEDEREALVDLCARRGLALICDEVFSGYALAGEGPPSGAAGTLAGEGRALTFVLDGLSKMLALPQMKLGWIAASGPREELEEALGRLEIIADTFLSVNTPVQAALPELLALREDLQRPLRDRTRANLERLRRAFPDGHPASLLPVEGGWSAILKVPATRTDEEWTLSLLEEEGVLAHPGYLFGFPGEGRLVVSLLPSREEFAEAAARMARHLAVT